MFISNAMERLEDRHREWRASDDKRAQLLSERYVPGEGSLDPAAFIIGEAPGAQEDMALRPLVGPSGYALRGLMKLAGLSATHTAWITNVVKFRPLQNRTPSFAEVMSVRHLLLQEWVILGKPQLIIPVGRVALEAVYGRPISITRVSGQCDERKSKGVASKRLFIWPMIHPAFALRNEQARPLLERDWVKLAEWRFRGNKTNEVLFEGTWTD